MHPEAPLLALSSLAFAWTAALTLLQLAGLAAALHAILHSRTPQAALGWAVSLALLPLIALPLYLVFGQSRFSGYELADAAKDNPLGRLKRAVRHAMEPHRCAFPREFSDLTRLVEKLSQLPATAGNRLELLVDGQETFTAIFEAIRAARHSVLAQFYIIHDDDLGRAFQRELLAARQRGVSVHLLYDEVGSKKLPPTYTRRLEAAGVHVAAFVTNRALGARFQINFRNHRKLVLVDGTTAFTGGLNVGDEYMGRAPRFGPWRDTHLRVEGPAILPLYLGFCEDWHFATGTLPQVPVPAPHAAGHCPALSFCSGPADELEICPVIYLGALREARHRIWLASPYFVPDTATRLALQHAALRGVEVRVLLPDKPDHRLPYLTSFSYYPALKQAGIQVYRYLHGFMHQKVLLVDDHLAMVGSINFDHRSFLLNFEHAVLACDRAFAAAVELMLRRDFQNARREDLDAAYSRRSFWFRLLVRFASLTAPEQ